MHQSWGDFYELKTNYMGIIITSIPIFEGTKFYIKFSVFLNLTTDGAITFRTPDPETRVLVEDTSFMNCSQKHFHGGAISYGRYNNHGSLIQNRVCSMNCSSGSGWTGSHSYVVNHPGDKSDMILVSIANNNSPLSFAPFHVADTVFNLDSLNVSKCLSNAKCIFHISRPYKGSVMKFCSYDENSAVLNTSIHVDDGDEFTQKFCNVISNKCENEFILNSGIYIIYNCNFVDNEINSKEKYYINNRNKIVMENCSIVNSPGENIYSSIISKNIKDEEIIFDLYLLSTGSCFAVNGRKVIDLPDGCICTFWTSYTSLNLITILFVIIII